MMLPLCPPEALQEELADIACERDRALSRPAVCPERRAEYLADLERWRAAFVKQIDCDDPPARAGWRAGGGDAR